MGEKTLDFAIVCDNGCDLPDSLVESLGVTLVCVDGLSGEKTQQALAAAYLQAAGSLTAADAGMAAAPVAAPAVGPSTSGSAPARVVSVHSAEALSGVVCHAHAAAASVEDSVHVDVLDTGTASAATGLVVEFLARCRAAGMSCDEALAETRALADRAKLLVIPSAGAPFAKRRMRSERPGLLGKASSLVRAHISGERALYLVARGEVTTLARSTDLIDLTSRLAHAISAVWSVDGELLYVPVKASDARAFRAMEKPLDTNEFEARRLRTAHASSPFVVAAGQGLVAAALVPAARFESVAPAVAPADPNALDAATLEKAAGGLGQQKRPAVLLDSAFPEGFIDSL